MTGRRAQQAQEAALSWMDAFPCVAHQLSSWDALVLNVAAEGGARLLLTEDLHPGFSWRGVRVVNPLAPTVDPLLEQLLGPSASWHRLGAARLQSRPKTCSES